MMHLRDRAAILSRGVERLPIEYHFPIPPAPICEHAMIRSAAALSICLLFSTTGFAQLAPELGYVYPAGGKAGTAINVQLGGAEWTPDMQFFCFDPRVKLDTLGPPGELLIPPPPYWFGAKGRLSSLPLLRERPAKFTLPADLPHGPIRWQASNANGSTSVGVFIIGAGTELMEDEKRKGSQPLPALPVCVNGRLWKNEEVDRYSFKAAAAGPVTCELAARRLGSNFHGVIEVTDAKGVLVAEDVDTEGNDAALTFAAAAGMEYTIAVRDIDHTGDRSFVYRLDVRSGPRVLATIPAAGQRGESREVEFLLATSGAKIESIKKPVAFPAIESTTFPVKLDTPWGSTTREMTLSDLKDLPALAVPGAITASFDKSNAEAKYPLTGKKGDRWAILVEARRFGSPVDPSIKLLGADGKPVAMNDDLPGTSDAGLDFTLPADGTYQLVVTDAGGAAPSRTAIFRVSIRTPVDGFTLSVANQKLNAPLGAKAALAVKAIRTGNFKEPITLTFTGLPPGVTITPAPHVIPANVADVTFNFDVPATSGTSASLLTISGTATVAGKPMTKNATAPLVPTAGNLAPRSPEETQANAVAFAITMKPRVKGQPVDKDTGRKVPRGSTHPADIALQRLEGYAGEITLRQAARQSYQVQGITGRDTVVPAGAVAAAYPCFMPEWLETIRTSRMGIVSEVKIADPKGVVRTLVAPIDGFVTMTMEGALLKLSSDPEVAVKPGEPIVVKVKLARSPRLTEPVKLELVMPDEIASAVKFEPVVANNGQAEVEVRIVVLDATRLAGEPVIGIRGTAIQPGNLRVVSETAIKVIVAK
jgi:hypothetical protein